MGVLNTLKLRLRCSYERIPSRATEGQVSDEVWLRSVIRSTLGLFQRRNWVNVFKQVGADSCQNIISDNLLAGLLPCTREDAMNICREPPIIVAISS